STAVPSVADSGDPDAVELGVSFTPSSDGQITGVRFYKSTANGGTHTGSLWSAAGNRLATGTFSGETASGWQTLTFSQAVAVTAGTTYVASYFAPQGHYAVDSGYFDKAWQNGPLAASLTNGLYRYGSSGGFPNDTYGATNYWVDPVFQTGSPADHTAPSVTSTTPLAGSSSQSATNPVSATFDEAVKDSSISFTLKDSDGASVTGTTAYTAATKTATFTPAASLSRGKTYTASVTATDPAGNAMSQAKTWTFTTAQPDPTPGVCPCSIWTDATTPDVLAEPDSKVEVGTAFTTDTAGSITGVRFYKGAANTGPHTVSLWNSSGTRLATATSTDETTQGWQTVTFDQPVAVTSGTTYIVSYLAGNGNYSVTESGLATPIDRSPLHTLATGGRYAYGGGFPSNTYNSSYFVDPIFTTGGGATAAPTGGSTASATPTGTATTTAAPTGTASASATPTAP
uniref:DUF4082 domain-containing protein n=1 Tax=Intrasporangium sp. TaxID=1925024 RepID=UPI003221B509